MRRRNLVNHKASFPIPRQQLSELCRVVHVVQLLQKTLMRNGYQVDQLINVPTM